MLEWGMGTDWELLKRAMSEKAGLEAIADGGSHSM